MSNCKAKVSALLKFQYGARARLAALTEQCPPFLETRQRLEGIAQSMPGLVQPAMESSARH
jgi:hypothetical protein